MTEPNTPTGRVPVPLDQLAEHLDQLADRVDGGESDGMRAAADMLRAALELDARGDAELVEIPPQYVVVTPAGPLALTLGAGLGQLARRHTLPSGSVVYRPESAGHLNALTRQADQLNGHRP